MHRLVSSIPADEMNLTAHQEGLLVIACSLYLIVVGLTAKTLITESDIPATKEEKEQAKATPVGRAICVVIGLCGLGYGILRILH